MSVYRKGKIWYIDYYVHHKRYRESVGPGTKRDAEEALAKRKVQLKENRFFDRRVVYTKTFDQLVTEYMAKHPRRESRHVALLAHFTGQLVCNIKPSHVEEFKKQRAKSGVAVSTVNRELAMLKTMFNWLKKDGLLDSNPCTPVKFFSEEHLQRDRVLTDDEYARLLQHSNNDLRTIIELAWHTAMRRGEILNLTWNKIDMANGVIQLTHTDTKTKRGREIPLTNHVLHLLSQRIRRLHCPYVFERGGQPIADIKTAFNAACKRAGLVNFHFHDLRHTAITRWVRAGVPERTIMRITGHRTLKAYDRYVNLKADDLKAALRNAGQA